MWLNKNNPRTSIHHCNNAQPQWPLLSELEKREGIFQGKPGQRSIQKSGKIPLQPSLAKQCFNQDLWPDLDSAGRKCLLEDNSKSLGHNEKTYPWLSEI